MAAYRLYTVVPRLVRFIDQLSKWYVRLNRGRLKGSVGGENAQFQALSTLYHVLLTITVAMGPFTPFVSEYFYQNLRKVLPDKAPNNQGSVHWVDFPVPLTEAFNE